MQKIAPLADVMIRLGVPPQALDQAAHLYWQNFGRQIMPLPVRRHRGEAFVANALRLSNVLVALNAQGRVLGMAGLRDASGGMLDHCSTRFVAAWGPMGRPLHWAFGFYRAGGDTSDLIIDGIAVLRQFRGQGLARALIEAAAEHAHLRGYPGLCAEVQRGNHPATALYLSSGFQLSGESRIGWPWSGRAQIMRRPVPAYSPRSYPSPAPEA